MEFFSASPPLSFFFLTEDDPQLQVDPSAVVVAAFLVEIERRGEREREKMQLL